MAWAARSTRYGFGFHPSRVDLFACLDVLDHAREADALQVGDDGRKAVVADRRWPSVPSTSSGNGSPRQTRSVAKRP
jgi:hypothetical protein